MAKTKHYFKRKVFQVPLYGGKLVIIDSNCVDKIKKHTDFDEGAINWLKERDLFAHVLYDQEHKGLRAYHVIFNTSSDTRITPGIIAHEASHVTSNIFHDVGWKHDYMNEEPYSYLVSWVTDCIHEFLNK